MRGTSRKEAGASAAPEAGIAERLEATDGLSCEVAGGGAPKNIPGDSPHDWRTCNDGGHRKPAEAGDEAERRKGARRSGWDTGDLRKTLPVMRGSGRRKTRFDLPAAITGPGVFGVGWSTGEAERGMNGTRTGKRCHFSAKRARWM